MPHLTPTAASGSRTQSRLILTVALLPRLAILSAVAAKYPATPLFSRGLEMGLLARSLVQGNGLSSPFGFPAAQVPTGPTALIAPGYPLFVAAIFRLFGTYSFASELVLITLQIAASLITLALILHLARTLFNPRVAIVAGLLWALSPPLLFLPTIFWDTTFATALLAGLLALILRIQRNPTPLAWSGLGAYCALAALLTPALLPTLLAGTLWLAWQTPRRSRALLAALTFTLLFAPWPLRNARVFHTFIPLRTTLGFELWMGNRPGATGYLDESFFPTFNPHELADYKRLGELAYTNEKSQVAKQFIREHPVTFVHLTALRIARFWLGTGTRNGSPFFPLHAVLTSTFGLLGLALLFRYPRSTTTPRHPEPTANLHHPERTTTPRHPERSEGPLYFAVACSPPLSNTTSPPAIAILFALPLLLFPLPYYLTHAEFRYRILLDPLLTVLAAHALTHLAATFNTRRASSPLHAGHTHPHPHLSV